MKIGILTLPLHTNYGGILQAYALQTVLERMGHDVEVLDRPHKKKVDYKKIPFILGKNLIKRYVLRKHTLLLPNISWNRDYPTVSQNTEKFIFKHIHSREVTNLSILKEEEYDALVVGSDQIWRSLYYRNIEDAYFSFAASWKNVKRIAYAPSFGTDKWEYTSKQTKRCRSLIKKFDLVTVRENIGIKFCNEKLGVNAYHVLDPTMLLNKSDYVDLVKNSGVSKSEGNLMVYVLDPNKDIEESINRYAIEKNLSAFYVSSKVENYFAPLNERIQKSVEQWLRGFMDAEFVITDSFHACAFSIIFNKPFAVIGNKERGMSRFESLLHLFGLDKRLVTSINNIDSLSPIDWNFVNNRRNFLVDKSLEFLKNALEQKFF